MEIYIKGARVHNLKNIELRIPHNKLVVITGLSGSGKSTLAFDTIFAEGQRRYVESLSAYARQFLGRIDKPDVDLITGIAPAIAVQQKVSTRNPRSTVGTSTEIYEYLRLLFARVGQTFSPVSGERVTAWAVQDVVECVVEAYSVGFSSNATDFVDQSGRVVVSADLVLEPGQGLVEKLTLLLGEGFDRLLVDGAVVQVQDFIASSSSLSSTGGGSVAGVRVLVDRMILGGEGDAMDEVKTRLADSLGRALAVGDSGVCYVNDRAFSTRFEADGLQFDRPSEHMFSFNNPIGACPRCEGYGRVVGIDEDLVIPDKSKSLYDDAIVCWRGETMSWWKDQMVMAAAAAGLPLHKPFYMLDRAQRLLLWTGNSQFGGLNAFFEFLEKERYKIQYRVMLSRYTGRSVCPECHGGRLAGAAYNVRVGGRTIVELAQMPIDDLVMFFDGLELDAHDLSVAERVLVEIRSRLGYMQQVGLGYLTLDRGSATLSGGESQRINLATSLGSSLVGSLYILDEPSIGLHPRDTHRLIGVLKALRDLGNTVIVVEHESEIIAAADQLIDIGPLAGVGGGEVVFQGSPLELCNAIATGDAVHARSLTAEYMCGRMRVSEPRKARAAAGEIMICGARENNLKNIDVRIPLGVLTCITGVSGSGKSSLVGQILYPALRRHMVETGTRPGDFDGLKGDLSKISGVELVDQNPIGKSLRSNAVTYIKAWDEIRKLYSDQPVARNMNFDASSFSFNIAGGRCEMCKGEGVIHVSMQFMADVELVCENCGGRRFKDSVLEVMYRGKNIYDVLEMSVDEAMEFFGSHVASAASASSSDSSVGTVGSAAGGRVCGRIVEKLKVLQDVGLGYVKLGQSSSTLSGGESQRVKLAYYLLKENSAKPLFFIFDEPTTGLHFHDIKKLLQSFDALILRGHTVVIVEHNMDVVRAADWVVDLGPEGGAGGGELVFQGTPEALAASAADVDTLSGPGYTAQFLARSNKNV